MTPYSPVKVHQQFWRTYYLYLQCQARVKQESGGKQSLELSRFKENTNWSDYLIQ
jgi:hypothetical protein